MRYNSDEAPIRDFHTADYPLELGKVFTTKQEQADLENVIKLAQACGGEYVGVSAPFARKGEPDVTKFKFDDLDHANRFMAAYKYFANNVHLTEEVISPTTCT